METIINWIKYTDFKLHKSISELKIDKKRYFIVLKDWYEFKKWEIIKLKKDDNTFSPEFENKDWISFYMPIWVLAYYSYY